MKNGQNCTYKRTSELKCNFLRGDNKVRERRTNALRVIVCLEKEKYIFRSK